MKKLLYILLLLPLSVLGQQTYQQNTSSVWFRDTGGTGTGKPGGSILTDVGIKCGTKFTVDSTGLLSTTNQNMGLNIGTITLAPGFTAPFAGIYASRTDGQLALGGYLNSVVAREQMVFGFNRRNRINGLAIFPAPGGSSLMGITLSHWDTINSSPRYQYGNTYYPDRTDMFSYDRVTDIDLALVQCMDDGVRISDVYGDSLENKIHAHIIGGVYIFNESPFSQDTLFVIDTTGAIKMPNIPGSGDVVGISGSGELSKVSSAGQVSTSDYGASLVLSAEQRNISVAFTGSGTGASTVNISALPVGAVVRVSDLDNKAALNNIVIDAGTGNTINMQGTTGQTTTIIVDGSSYTLQKLTATKWMVI